MAGRAVAVRLSRRRWLMLAAAAGGLASACTRAPVRGVAQGAGGDRHPLVVITLGTPEERAAFAAFDPRVQVLSGVQGSAAAARSTAGLWGIGSASPFSEGRGYVGLTAALRRVNFRMTRLLPAAVPGFTSANTLYALPVGMTPFGIAYRPAVFEAARVAVPAADWTVDDFLRACAGIQGAVRAGRVPGG